MLAGAAAPGEARTKARRPEIAAGSGAVRTAAGRTAPFPKRLLFCLPPLF